MNFILRFSVFNKNKRGEEKFIVVVDTWKAPATMLLQASFSAGNTGLTTLSVSAGVRLEVEAYSSW